MADRSIAGRGISPVGVERQEVDAVWQLPAEIPDNLVAGAVVDHEYLEAKASPLGHGALSCEAVIATPSLP